MSDQFLVESHPKNPHLFQILLPKLGPPSHLSVAGNAVALVHLRPPQRGRKGGEVDGHLPGDQSADGAMDGMDGTGEELRNLLGVKLCMP